MFICIWEFRVTSGCERDFERIYAPDGDWAQLFQLSPEYAGTELYRDISDVRRYLTIDLWRSKAAFHALKNRFHDDYVTLDGRCSYLTDSERLIGEIES